MTNTQNPKTLSTLYAAQASLNLDIHDAVAQARAEGATWDAIGSQLHITRQAAQQKYGTYVSRVNQVKRDTSRDDQFTPEENAKADEALAILTAISEPNTDTRPETPSIFLDPIEPAKPWTPPADSPLGMYDSRETSDWYALYGCGECGRKDRPDTCPNCRRR